MKNPTLLATLAVVAAGCAGPTDPVEPTPELYATGSEAPPDEALSEEERELRELLEPLYARCEGHRDELEAERRGWRRRLATETIVAGVAAQTADIAEGQDTDLPQPGTPGTNFVEPMPSWAAGAGSPTREAAGDAHSDAVRHVRRMNDAIEELDEFLFAHPHPAQWSEEERADFDRLRGELRRVCD